MGAIQEKLGVPLTENTIRLIEDSINQVEADGFGEVIVKIRNGAVYRILRTSDVLLDKQDLTRVPQKE